MANKAGMATGVEVARISVKVSPDTRQFRRDLKSDLDAIENSLKAKIDVEPNMGNFRKEVQAKTAGMSTKVKVDADVDKGFVDRIRGVFDKIPTPSFGSGINPAGYALIFAAILAVAAPLIGLVTTALLALPGLIALVAAPIAAITLGLDGLKKAAGVLKAPFDDLKATMSARVQEQFTPVFETLGKIFPTLKSALPTVSQGLADMAQSVANVVTSPEGLARINTIITNIGAALSKAGPGIGNFVDGFLKLAETFTGGSLQGVIDWFNGAGKSFNDWITKLQASGDLSTAFSGLGQSLKVILDFLGRIATTGLDFMSDPAKVERFVNGLKTVADFLGDIVDLSNKLAGVDFGPVGDFFSAINFMNWDETFAKAKEAGPGLWDSIKNGASEAWTWIQGVWAPIGSFFSGIFAEVGAITGPVWDVISTAATTAWNVIAAIWGGARDFLSGIWAGLSEAAAPVWQGISNAATAAWGVIQAVWAPFASWFAGIWNGVVGVVQGIWNTIKSVISSAASEVINIITNMGSSIISAIQSIDLAAAGKALIQRLIGGITSMAGAVKDAVSSVIGGVMNLIPHSPAKEGPFAGQGWNAIFTGGQALGEQFGNGLQDGLQSTLDMAKEMADKISKAINDGTDATGALNGIGSDDLKKSLAVIEQEKKRLKLQKNALPDSDKEGRKALQNQIDQLQAQKDILSYQKDRVKNEKDFGDAAGDDPLVKAASGLMASPVNFAKATGKQFLSDIGIGGEGAISKAITEGISYVFQIGSVDEALSIKDREESKNALAVVGRQ